MNRTCGGFWTCNELLGTWVRFSLDIVYLNASFLPINFVSQLHHYLDLTKRCNVLILPPTQNWVTFTNANFNWQIEFSIGNFHFRIFREWSTVISDRGAHLDYLTKINTKACEWVCVHVCLFYSLMLKHACGKETKCQNNNHLAQNVQSSRRRYFSTLFTEIKMFSRNQLI